MTKTHLTLRTAGQSDLDALLSLEYRACTELNRGCYPRALMDRAAREMKMITPELLAEGHFFVLVGDSDRIVACGGWSQQTPGYAEGCDSHDTDIAEDVAIVRSMFVDPAMARRGLGRRMMDHIETDARAHGIRRLTLSATRMGQPLYRACGFEAVSEDTYTLSDGSLLVGMEMRKSLAPFPVTEIGRDIAGAAA